MAKLIWSDKFATGYTLIDEQHKSLFEATNALMEAIVEGKGKAEERRTLDFLIDYTQAHFKAEEALMVKHRFPQLEAHRIEHQNLLKRCLELREDLAKTSFTLQIKVFDFLSGWIRQHVANDDFAFIDHLRSQPGAAAPATARSSRHQA